MPLTSSRLVLRQSSISPLLRKSAFNSSSASTPTSIRSMSLIAHTATKGKGVLFSEQDKLPNLPVPPLEQTLNKYLKSTIPLHGSKESLSKTESAVKSALEGPDSKTFKELQSRLEKRRNDEGRDNWLSDWWNEAAYMAYRDPVVPYVSYFYAHKDDRSRRDSLVRSASQLKAMLAFRRLLESEQLTPEKTKAGAMCSASYPWMFNACRIPEKPADGAIKYEAEQNNHLVVAHNNRFWEFDLIVDGKELSAEEIVSQLQKIVSDPASSSPDPLPVGALTSVNRDQWTDSRQALLNVQGAGGEQNKKALEKIQSSVIVLCLDDLKSITKEEIAMNLWFGNGKNRFYDKQQLISMPGGKSGFMGEHSCMDGTPTLRMNDFVLASLEQNKIDLGSSNRSDLAKPMPIAFALDKNLEAKIGESIKDFDALKERHDISMLDFQGYGKGQMKKFKCSPDGWAQMAIQLAYYRMFGKPCATYESAQTRKFKLGRTETIRSASVDSKAFCEIMEDPKSSDEERFQKFTTAVKAHLTYAAACADGQGVDRHLFGLKKLLKEGETLPELYKDEMFGTSSTWKLSTSQISSERFESWGFGEVTPTGFGIAYAIKEESLTFTITSLKLDAPRLRHYINEALLDIREMHVNLKKKEEKSKM